MKISGERGTTPPSDSAAVHAPSDSRAGMKPVLYALAGKVEDLPEGDAWLSREERACLASMRFPKRRNDWKLGRWTAKLAIRAFLSGSTGPPLPDIEVLAAPDGAPEAFLRGKPAPVSLSISHSAGAGFCVVSRPGLALGCDLERVDARDYGFMADYFTREENDRVRMAAAEDRPLVAVLIWCGKECALKAMRLGLRRDTRSVSVSWRPPEGAAAWGVLAVRCLESSRIFHGWWRSQGGYVYAVAAGIAADPPMELLP